jgi:hypothetical protein
LIIYLALYLALRVVFLLKAFKEINTMKINEKAPVIASGEIEVAADASIIWEIMF